MNNPTESEAAGPAVPVRAWGGFDTALLAAVAACLTWAYWPNLQALVAIWNREPDYSHGYLVIPIAAFIFWSRWSKGVDRSPLWRGAGWALVVAALVARAVFNERGQNWSETFSLMPLLVGLGLALLGRKAFLEAWPAFAFLIFLFPLEPHLNERLSLPLQGLATRGACALLKVTGLWVMPEGNVIFLGTTRLEVATACNGLGMLMSLSATVVAFTALMPMSTAKRITLLALVVPIALVSNVIRIAATAWCYHLFGSEFGSKVAHDVAGWAMMPTALVIVMGVLGVLSWVFVESEAVAADRLVFFNAGRGSGAGPRP